MPGLDGEAVHARLREAGSTLGVIVLTAHGEVDLAPRDHLLDQDPVVLVGVRDGRIQEEGPVAQVVAGADLVGRCRLGGGLGRPGRRPAAGRAAS